MQAILEEEDAAARLRVAARMTPPNHAWTTLLARPRWALRAARLVAHDPVEGLDRALIRARGLHRPAALDINRYPADQDWMERLHQHLGVPWPCPAADGFDAVWLRITTLLHQQGLAMGRGAYGGWDDADQDIGRAVWCSTAHLRPLVVVETGVARGITTRVMLEGLERNGAGHLWSIDLPPLDPSLHPQIGAAIEPHLSNRWTYLRGTSRRRLPRLLAELQPIDLFVHDSLHSTRNLRFELTHAWSALRPGGVVVADDIERNGAFGEFQAHHDAEPLVAAANDARACFGFLLKHHTPAPVPLAGSVPSRNG